MIHKNYYSSMSEKQLNDEYMNACAFGYLEVVQYLLTSPELKKIADIHYQEDIAIVHACSNGKLNIVQYLLNSKELKKEVNIHTHKDSPFICACNNSKINIIEYLIFEYEIEYTNYIKDYLDKYQLQNIINMFKIREAKEELEIKLNTKTNHNHNISIKNKI